MLRRGMLLFCLLMTSLIVSTTAHARELPTAAALECSGELHAEGDTDQLPGDSDKGVLHQHGNCHGHSFFVAVSDTPSGLSDGVAANFYFPVGAAFARWSTGPALRPPIA